MTYRYHVIVLGCSICGASDVNSCPAV